MKRVAPVFRHLYDPLTGGHRISRVGDLTQEVGRWSFTYALDYLSLGAAAWELDPGTIRTKQRSPFTFVGSQPHPVFVDAAVSGWSEGALKRIAARGGSGLPPIREWGWWERLVYAPIDGTGALIVGDPAEKGRWSFRLSEVIEDVGVLNLMHDHLESSSGAMGGERPKAPFKLQSADGVMRSVLIKFALPGDPAGSLIAELTALTLARQLGLQVPEHSVAVVKGKAGLCIERFDRGPGMPYSVTHCVSAATAMNLPRTSTREDASRNYVALRSKLKHPADAEELFRRIVLNALVNNTDDHPWNTSLIQLGVGDWRLSPLYDVAPFKHRLGPPSFAMAITRRGTRTASMKALIQCAREIAGLSPEEARCKITAMAAHVRDNWRPVFLKHGAAAPVQTDADDWSQAFEGGIPED